MIRRFYVHNFRCFENFELPIADRASVLLIGKNGSGKTSIGLALEVLQRIARGTNRVDDAVKPKDLGRGRTDVPMRFEIEVTLADEIFKYSIAFEFPAGFKELRVREEGFWVNGKPVFTRELAQVHLARTNQEKEAKFFIDWHLAALPIVQEQTPNPYRSKPEPLSVFKQWLARAIILRPIPSLMKGDSEHETLQPGIYGTNFGAWFSGLLGYAPAAYASIDQYLKQVMPDLKDIKNPVVGKEARSLEVQFANDLGSMTIPFADLSDGEKCFMLCAMVLAANEAYGPLVCFWDEPDNHLALDEVGLFIATLRKKFQASGGQFIATSHNPEAIRRFSEENTLLVYRKSHLEPANVQPLSKLDIGGDLVGALIRGDIAA